MADKKKRLLFIVGTRERTKAAGGPYFMVTDLTDKEAVEDYLSVSDPEERELPVRAIEAKLSDDDLKVLEALVMLKKSETLQNFVTEVVNAFDQL